MTGSAANNVHSADRPLRINLSWHVRLRWGAIVGQLVTIAVVHRVMAIPLPLQPLLALVGLEAATNVAALGWLRSGRLVHSGCFRSRWRSTSPS